MLELFDSIWWGEERTRAKRDDKSKKITLTDTITRSKLQSIRCWCECLYIGLDWSGSRKISSSDLLDRRVRVCHLHRGTVDRGVVEIVAYGAGQ